MKSVKDMKERFIGMKSFIVEKRYSKDHSIGILGFNS